MSSGESARLGLEFEAAELLRGITTPAVYARDSFGMLGLFAILSVFEKPFFHAAAAILVGVFGSIGVSSSSLFLDCGCEPKGVDVVEVMAKGSEFRKEWEADWRVFFVFVTREVRFEARREDLRSGGFELEGVVRGRFVVEAAKGCVVVAFALDGERGEVMLEIDMRRMAG